MPKLTTTTNTLTPAQILGAAPLLPGGLPSIYTKRPISELARAVATNIPRGALWLYHGRIVTISHKAETDTEGNTYHVPEVKDMDADRFPSWVEQFISFRKAEPVHSEVESLGKPKVVQILASDILRNSLPEVRRINAVRLPIWGPTDPATGKRTIKLADPGYDAATGIYTMDLCPYSTTRADLPSLHRALCSLLGEFPWDDITDGSHTFATSRNVACFMAYMVGQYCRNLITLQPLILVNANTQGSGKTLLAAIGLSPVHGAPTVTPCPNNDEELRKTLFATLAAGASYCLLDDLPSLVASTVNQFSTAPKVSDRKMHSQEIITFPNTMQIISTGNNLKITPDIERRALIIDLFAETKPTETTHTDHLEISATNRPKWRSSLLSVLYNLLQHWVEAGMPAICPRNAKSSFESFVAIAGNITRHSGFADPFAKRPSDGTSGDTVGKLCEHLICGIAGASCPAFPADPADCTRTCSLQELLEAANAYGITDSITYGHDKLKSLGQKLRNFKGRKFTDTRGRRFQFGRRRSVDGTRYDFFFFTGDTFREPALPQPAETTPQLPATEAECPF